MEKTIRQIEPREEYYYDKQEKHDFDSLCYKIQVSKTTLVTAIENWLNTGEQLSFSNSITGKKCLDQSSAMLIEDFGKIMEEVCDVRAD